MPLVSTDLTPCPGPPLTVNSKEKENFHVCTDLGVLVF